MDEEQKFYTIILRHDESTKWMINNPILALGEYGVEDDTHRIKRGDGISKWEELNYEHFGLEYLITYENIQGKVEDNAALKAALDDKIPYSAFSNLSNGIVTGINIIPEEDGIGKVTKLTRSILDGGDKKFELRIVSDDQSIQGSWGVDKEGVRLLNLKANPAIDDYTIGRKYFEDQICFYNNRLYRAVTDFVADAKFNEKQWVILASMHSQDIKYDNKISGLESMTVKEAIDELQDLDSHKLTMSKRSNKVYGTTEDGQQIMIDRDDLRTVDSVNGKVADNQETKNIQLDSSEINYDDNTENKQTIKEVLDSKVDKNVAGEGKKIVRDLTTEYREEDGKLLLKEDKVSLVDGSSEEETVELDIVSETELTKTKEALETRMTEEDNKLNQAIVDMGNDLDQKINTTKTELTDKINTDIANTRKDLTDNINELNDAVVTMHNEQDARITEEVETLNNKIDTEIENLDTKFTNEVSRLDGKVDNNKDELNNRITEVNNNLTNRIDREVNDINQTIIDISNETNETISNNKADIEDKLNKGLNTKIDKDIADSIVIGIEMSTEIRDKIKEPTIKVTSKNTDTETEVIHHLHFAKKGDIELSTENDHIVIDTTEIDSKIADNTRRLDDHDTTLESHNTRLNALARHDTETDRALADHQEHITNHEERMTVCEDRLDGLDTTTANLDSKIENEITTRHVEDAKLETDISRNALNIENNAANIRENADNITELNNLLQENVSNLTQKKLDKEFAKEINNEIVGDLDIKEATNNEILILDSTKINPTDNSLGHKELKVISSDNTVIAKPVKDEDGNITAIDIATNLDTDVNYFVTTEIINTTIASETTLQLVELTATDKTEVEVQDIISDPEGTWGRVKSVDKENGTCVVVTFKKHAQAVWGTVKGDIEDQQDLKAKLLERVNKNFTQGNGIFNLSGYAGEKTDEDLAYNDVAIIKYKVLNPKAEESYVPQEYKLPFVSIDKAINFEPATHNGITNIGFKINSENIVIDPKESGLTSTKLGDALRELQTNKFDAIKNEDIIKGLNFSTQNKVGGADSINTYYFDLQYRNFSSAHDSTEYSKWVKIPLIGFECSKGFKREEIVINRESYNIFSIDSNTIDIDKMITGLKSDKLTASIKELKDLIDAQQKCISYERNIEIRANDIIYCIRPDGLAYVGIANKAFTSDNTDGDSRVASFVTDCTNGNIARFGIPQEAEDVVIPDLPPESPGEPTEEEPSESNPSPSEPNSSTEVG